MSRQPFSRRHQTTASIESNDDLAGIIAEAAQKAEAEFILIERLMTEAEQLFRAFSARMDAIGNEVPSSKGHLSRVTNAIKKTLRGHRDLSLSQWQELRKNMNTLRKEAGEFTLMFFGRTMSGKSTTFEAFIQGDGSRIGNGAPDFTKDVEPLYWKGLRLIDTPGLEGFNERIREIALSWIERSDVIAMVISDDHIEPILLERMAQIIKHNKPLIILLNIKCGVAERLLQHPEWVFRPDEIDGHTRRIRGFLAETFREYHTPLKVEAIRIFPYSAEAAFLSHFLRSKDPNRADAFARASRFEVVTDHLVGLVKARANIIRSKAAYDTFLGRLEKIEDDLRIRLASIKSEADTLEQKEGVARDMVVRLQEHAKDHFEALLKPHFCEVEEELDPFVDSVATGGEREPLRKLNTLIGWKKIEAHLFSFRKQTQEEVLAQIAQFERDMKIDVEIVFDNQARKRKLEFDPTTFDFDWGQFKRKAGRRGKIYGAPLAGAGAMALTGWAVANWWNPSGWLAAVAAVGTVAVGYAASKLTEKVSVNLVESGDKTIKKERTKLRESLRKRIEDEYLSLRKDNLAWAEQVINKAEATLTDSIKIAIDRASELRSVGRQMVRDLVRLRSQVAVAQLKSLLPLSYPPQIVDAVEVLRVARRVGYRTKILIKSRSGKPVGGLVVGGNGANLRLLADNLGAEPIDIVEQEAGGLGIREVLSSIRPARVAPERVLIKQDRRLHRIKVKLTLDPQNIRLFRGPYQWNMQLCRELLNCDFEVSEEEEYHEESADRDRVPTAS